MTIKQKNNSFCGSIGRFLAIIITISCISYSKYSFSKESSQEKGYKNKEIQLNYIENKKDIGLIKKYKDWNIYKINKKNYKTCYAISVPITTKGNKIKRAQPYFIVSDLINDADEIMVTSGFVYKENNDIEVSVGSKKFHLFGYKNLGWAYSKNDDIDLIKELQKNDEFLVTSSNKEGKINIDRYSLIGFKKAYFKLKETCKKLK